MPSQNPAAADAPLILPLISVVIPAYLSGAIIVRAVRSVLDGGVESDLLEILIESDDGQDYAQAQALSPAVKVGVTGLVRSGVGPARNRAMARARGTWLAFLDADDAFAAGYLAALLARAQNKGAAAAPLIVSRADRPVLSLWQGQDQLRFADLGVSGASVRMMVARALCPPFIDALSQDILHAVQVMAALGGAVPLSDRPYHLALTPGSVTAAQDFSARVAEAYHAHIQRIGTMDFPPEMRRAAQDVFRSKLALNAEFEASGLADYYGFIAAKLGNGMSPDGADPAG